MPCNLDEEEKDVLEAILLKLKADLK